MRENTVQENSECGHSSHSGPCVSKSTRFSSIRVGPIVLGHFKGCILFTKEPKPNKKMQDKVNFDKIQAGKI